VSSGADTSICSGEIITFDLGAGYDSYIWNDMSTNTIYTIDSDTVPNGDFEITVEVSLFGCESSDTLILSIGDLAVDLGNDTTLCLNQDIILTAGTFDSYSWNTGQLTETIQVGPFVSSGLQTYILEATLGSCQGSDTLVITIDNCLSVENYENLLSIFPNPSNGHFFVTFDVNHFIKNEITILDVSGRVVYNSFMNTNKQNIDISNYDKGFYFLVLKGENYQITKKIEIIN
jgi:chitodextrinase